MASGVLNPLELQPRQPRIKPVGGDQGGVGALLDDAALIHHHDAVAGQHSGEPVGDHQRGAVAHQFLQRGLHQGLALRIERRGGLVEQQQRRVAQDSARDRDALALAAGQRDAALAELGLKAAGQPADEFGGMGEIGGTLDFGVGGVGPAEADVFPRAGRRTPPIPAAPKRCARALRADRPP